MKLVNVGIKTKSEEHSKQIVDWFKSQGVRCTWDGNAGKDMYYYVTTDNKVNLAYKLPINIKEITMDYKENTLEIKVGQKLSEFIKTDKSVMCYMDSKGTSYESNYKLKNYGHRTVTKVENGYFEVSGFGYGWFNISEVLGGLKVIGYKAPTDLYGGRIPKGTIYRKGRITPGLGKPVDEVLGADRTNNVPFEIVETWEPVYETQEEVITIGSNSVPVTVGVEKIAFYDRATDVVTLQEIVKLYSACPRAAVGNYLVGLNPSVRSIRIGCDTENHLFSLDEINQIIIAYKRINNG